MVETPPRKWAIASALIKGVQAIRPQLSRYQMGSAIAVTAVIILAMYAAYPADSICGKLCVSEMSHHELPLVTFTCLVASLRTSERASCGVVKGMNLSAESKIIRVHCSRSCRTPLSRWRLLATGGARNGPNTHIIRPDF